MVFAPSGMVIYKGLGPRKVYGAPNTGGTSIPYGAPIVTTSQVGHGLGGMFRAVAKSVMPVAKQGVKQLFRTAKMKAAPTLLKAGKGIVADVKRKAAPVIIKTSAALLTDIASNKNPKAALKRRTAEAKQAITKIGKQAIKRQASNVLTSFAPSAKRSKGAPKRIKKTKPQRTRRRKRNSALGPLPKGYKPARKLDIWEY